MFELSEFVKFETSERSASTNWVRTKLLQNGFILLSFEGYAIKNELVSLLLDRGLFYGKAKNYTDKQLFTLLKETIGLYYDLKVDFANRLSIPWLFLCYQCEPKKLYVIELQSDCCRKVAEFSSFTEFGRWTMNYRDMLMLSRYEESGLPKIDRILRKAGTPWPGNLDALLYRDAKASAVLEFQNTTKTTVAKHCNNTWFLPRTGRKGDENRWKAMDIIRLHANLPLIILVWSQKESVIKFKIVQEIVYSGQATSKSIGLHYKVKKLIKLSELIQELNKL